MGLNVLAMGKGLSSTAVSRMGKKEVITLEW